MPDAKTPSFQFDTGEISLEDIPRAIKRARVSSSPCPFDHIPYKVFRRCPSGSDCLKHKFVGRGSARLSLQLPSIALTSRTGKLYTIILKDRWLSFMLENDYLDPSIKKALIPATPELKLSTIISEVRKKKKSVAVCWLDIANAFGSVHHSLIQYSRNHYNASPEFLATIKLLYSDLPAVVVTQDWSTSAIPLQLGVYQGDPLSVVVFNTVTNTLVDTIWGRSHLGYTITNTSHTINLLQYTDDTCLIAKDPATCQHLLDVTDLWLQWSGMEAKVPKCHSLAIQSSTGKLVNPQLTLTNQQIPHDSIKFLGLTIQIPRNSEQGREEIKRHMLTMLQAVDQSGVTRLQKLKLYKQGICPRLSWLLTIHEFPTSWIQKQLEGPATKYLKE